MNALGMAALLIGTGAGAALPVQVGPDQQGSVTMQRRESVYAPALLLCDGTDGYVVRMISAPDRRRRAELWTYAKRDFHTQRMPVSIGGGDAGAGNIYYPLTGANGVTGSIRAVNPGMVDDATTPIIGELSLGRTTTHCRWSKRTRVMGVTPRRTVLVSAVPLHGYRYQTFNFAEDLAAIRSDAGHATRASLTIDGGRLIGTAGGRRVYEFVNRGYVYRVLASIDPDAGGGGVQVFRGGRLVLTEAFAGYTAARLP